LYRSIKTRDLTICWREE